MKKQKIWKGLTIGLCVLTLTGCGMGADKRTGEKDVSVTEQYQSNISNTEDMSSDENEKEKNYLNRYKAAVRFLENVAKGMIDIGIQDQKTTASSGFAMTSNERLFSRNSMKGM